MTLIVVIVINKRAQFSNNIMNDNNINATNISNNNFIIITRVYNIKKTKNKNTIR